MFDSVPARVAGPSITGWGEFVMRTIPSVRLAQRFLVGAAFGATVLIAGAVFAIDQPQHAKSAIEPLEELQAKLGTSDQVAALQALQSALNQVGDGGTYIWKKHDTRLKGIIKPTTAFRNAHGQVCRHVIYALSIGDYRKQIEIIACREAGGRWRL